MRHAGCPPIASRRAPPITANAKTPLPTPTSTTHSPRAHWHLTGRTRFNLASVRSVAGLAPPLTPPAAGLGNDLSFARLNPAAGASYTPESPPGFYAGFSHGNRPPSPAELGCADRN